MIGGSRLAPAFEEWARDAKWQATKIEREGLSELARPCVADWEKRNGLSLEEARGLTPTERLDQAIKRAKVWEACKKALSRGPLPQSYRNASESMLARQQQLDFASWLAFPGSAIVVGSLLLMVLWVWFDQRRKG